MVNQPPIGSQSILQVDNNSNGADQELAIEDMAARICLDDEADIASANTGAPAPVDTERDVAGPNRTIMAEEIAKMAPRYVLVLMLGWREPECGERRLGGF
jgi:hypothetical protein